MGKNWITSLFGALAGIPLVLQQAGVHVGHLGNGDWLSLISALGVAGLGLSAKDSNTTGAGPTATKV